MSQQQNLRPPDQNLVILSGRITRDSEVRATGTGREVCSFDIAMSRRFRDSATGEWKDSDPVFVPIIVWGEAAQRCQGRVNKGAPVFVEGRLQTSKWEDKETGKPRSRLEVVASRVQFLAIRSVQDAAVPQSSEPAAIGAKASEEPADYQNNQPSPSAKQSYADDEDIPF